MRQLNFGEIDDLVKLADHLENCGGCCQTGKELLGRAVSGIARARQVKVEQQAMQVESVLGGNDRKARSCAGCNTTKTILRCKLCKLPCCLQCQKSGAAHPHLISVRTDVKMTDDIAEYGIWDKAGNRVEYEYQDVPGKGRIACYKGTLTPITEKSERRVIGQRPKRFKNKALRPGDKFIIASVDFKKELFDLVD